MLCCCNLAQMALIKAFIQHFQDSKFHWANMGPTWILSAPDGPHVGPMNLAIRVGFRVHSRLQSCGWIFRSYPASHWPQRGSTGAPDTQYVQCLIGHGFTERKSYQSSTWNYQHIWWQKTYDRPVSVEFGWADLQVQRSGSHFNMINKFLRYIWIPQ